MTYINAYGYASILNVTSICNLCEYLFRMKEIRPLPTLLELFWTSGKTPVHRFDDDKRPVSI